MKPWTIEQVANCLSTTTTRTTQAPPYLGPRLDKRRSVGMAVESMKRHMTDEGWQIFAGLESAGYCLTGYGLEYPYTHTADILRRLNPGTLVVQDKREWDVRPGDFREPNAQFRQVELLESYPDVFKLTILKDSHQRQGYHKLSAIEMGCHAWIVYYHPDIVKALAPYVRREHLIRTYHTVDPDAVPRFSMRKRNYTCLLSGAVSSSYPLRKRLVKEQHLLPGVTYAKHPGYHRNGSDTPRYLKSLLKYKVVICTASRYGYSLRRIFEATACGCIVVTDLPIDDELPAIEPNLVRVHPETSTREIGEVIRLVANDYDADRQESLAKLAVNTYSYRKEGLRLANAINQLRENYNGPETSQATTNGCSGATRVQRGPFLPHAGNRSRSLP